MSTSSLPAHHMTPPVKKESGVEHLVTGYVFHVGTVIENVMNMLK